MLSNINILSSLRIACYYLWYWREIPPCFNFYVVTSSYSSRPFLCALDGSCCNDHGKHANLLPVTFY